MLILRNTDGVNRVSVHITRQGIESARWRTQVGGGWYRKEIVVTPWPWRNK